jgi:2-iminobutanoate/2-iminopropanoate deaminase
MIRRIPNAFSNSFSNVTIVPMGEYSTIYVAGQVGHPPSGPVKVTAESFEEEAKLCFGNIRLGLEKAGASLKDVVRITAYLTNLGDYPAYARVREETFKETLPASSTVQVAGLLVNARLEVDAIAVIKTGQVRG